MSGPFDFEREEIRRAFQPLMFPRVTVTIGDELVLTGRVKDVQPQVDAGASSVGITAYSLPYDLTEVCAPVESLPFEFSGLDLRQIVDRLVAPSVGVTSVFEGSPGAKFAKIRCQPDANLHNFLVDLALQRGFVVSDSPSGDLLLRAEGHTGAPVARLKGQPLVKVTADIEPGNWFSRITGRTSQKSGNAGAHFSAKNPLYRATNPRNTTISCSDTEAADVPHAVKTAIGRMIAGVIRVTVEDIPTWRDPRGALWKPNTTITLQAPGAMIYRETEFLIRSVKLHQTPDAETASLELVLTGSFGGQLPTELPWDL